MELKAFSAYKNLSDRVLVSQVLSLPHNEEAAVFLLYCRYEPLLRKIYLNYTKDMSWYDDCIDELFIHLKGAACDWHGLALFEWNSTFGYWLGKVARNKFTDFLPRLIDNRVNRVYIDDDEAETPSVQLPDRGEDDYERTEQKVLLLEAISLLEDEDQRFVILKRLQGYNSKEMALLLRKRWEKHGIRKFNNRHEEVIPDAAYVDVRTQRAKDNLRRIIAAKF